MIYDIIVLGGGIAGLYTTYEILKRDPTKIVLLLEKDSVLGGRVHTFHSRFMTVDAGAGRFSSNHHRIVRLIDELGLHSKISDATSSAVYMKANGSGTESRSILDAPYENSFSLTLVKAPDPKILIEPVLNATIDIALGVKNLPNAGLFAKVILVSKGESSDKLRNISFITFAKTILTKNEIEFMIDSYGFYSELFIMNAFDAIRIMESLNPMNKFFVLRGGLSQMIEGLTKKIQNYNHKNNHKHKNNAHNNAHILLNRTVSGIHKTADHLFEIRCANTKTRYLGRKLICALPKQVLETFRIFRPVFPLLRKINCAPLCRIYCKFDVSPETGGKAWFHGLSKLTTNNYLRMMIPINEKEGVIMISYTDGPFSEFWKDLYDRDGMKGVETTLARLVFDSTGRNMPVPASTNVFYWACGVGYWGVGADSAAISKRMTKPMDDLEIYVCGEHFSENYQQWMEGALETSDAVLQCLS